MSDKKEIEVKVIENIEDIINEFPVIEASFVIYGDTQPPKINDELDEETRELVYGYFDYILSESYDTTGVADNNGYHTYVSKNKSTTIRMRIQPNDLYLISLEVNGTKEAYLLYTNDDLCQFAFMLITMVAESKQIKTYYEYIEMRSEIVN